MKDTEKEERDVEKLKVQENNMVLKYKKTKLSIGKGALVCEGTYGLFQFWPFKHGKKSFNIPIKDIQFVDVFPYSFFRKGVDITYGNDQELVLISVSSNAIKQFVDQLTMEGFESKLTESVELEQPFRTKKILRMEGKYLVFRKYQHRGRMIDSANPEKVVYFDKVKRGLRKSSVDFGSLAGGGEDNSVFIDKITSTEVDSIRELLIKQGSKLADFENANRYKAIFPLFKPARWFSGREVLGFTEKGMLHILHTKGKSRSSYLPYDSIKVVSSDGVMFKRILIQGLTTISTIEKFSPRVWRIVKNYAKKHGVRFDNVVTFRPVRAFLSSSRRGIKLCLSDDGVIYKTKKETAFLNYEQVNEFLREKPNRISWFGDVIVKGYRRDARAGEGGVVEMKLPHIGLFRWKKLNKAYNEKKGKILNAK